MLLGGVGGAILSLTVAFQQKSMEPTLAITALIALLLVAGLGVYCCARLRAWWRQR